MLDGSSLASSLEELEGERHRRIIPLAHVRFPLFTLPKCRTCTNISISRFLWAVGAAFLGVYAITKDFNIPLIIQPQLFSFLSLVSWSQVRISVNHHPNDRFADGYSVGIVHVLWTQETV